MCLAQLRPVPVSVKSGESQVRHGCRTVNGLRSFTQGPAGLGLGGDDERGAGGCRLGGSEILARAQLFRSAAQRHETCEPKDPARVDRLLCGNEAR
jgi:hypothetical protein